MLERGGGELEKGADKPAIALYTQTGFIGLLPSVTDCINYKGNFLSVRDREYCIQCKKKNHKMVHFCKPVLFK